MTRVIYRQSRKKVGSCVLGSDISTWHHAFEEDTGLGVSNGPAMFSRYVFALRLAANRNGV